ncbi:alpha/beta hydrolase [Acinetobacter baumannii]|uniref:Alpha/beta hydrolase n=1 Tax=Acinetobacter baumannii TaxID=470 RepID=A0A505MS09_ACIBA|nr:alpha/beta hydrolase [Acinetobacter baumannii]EJB8497421.1 alpha/beta hydrolase [Acinetobacter baumannii]ELB0341880.1 alpha/beta hydrolase [Acinetobacter baumannii]KCY24601.1 alpha/beta hydrolase family protein [Acinetobacter baumannii 233846]MCJ8816191.1 alpha/beta hydrolase [Acinetobacter baumannii]MCJ8987361.1 alpha/beta hydrolase [Acinetobacter baumannii]
MEKQDIVSIAHRYLSKRIAKVTKFPTHKLKNENSSKNDNSCFFVHNFGTYELEAKLNYCEGSPQKTALLIHGGNSDLSSLNPLENLLREKNIATLSFNLSGLNNTSTTESSLSQNINESIVFYNYLKKVDIVIGYSLGGYIAINLAKKFQIDRLILLCPAIYSDLAVNKIYGEEFKNEISKPYSFYSTSTWNFLMNYKRQVLIIYGELDGKKTNNGRSKGFYEVNGITKYSPIPYEIVQTLKTISIRKVNFNLIIEKGKDHYLLKNIKKNNILKYIDF